MIVVVKIVNVNETPILNNGLSNQSQNEDATLSFTIPDTTFSDVDGDTLTYTTTLSDGSVLPSWLTFNATTLTFSGTPLNADVGAVDIIITASDGSLSASDTFTLTVINTNDDQGAQLHLLTPQAAIDAVGPYVDPAVFIQRFVTPTLVFLPPHLLQA